MIEMPTNMKELGINPTDEQIKDMAMKATNHDTQQLGAFKKLSAKDLVEIYKKGIPEHKIFGDSFSFVLISSHFFNGLFFNNRRQMFIK